MVPRTKEEFIRLLGRGTRVAAKRPHTAPGPIMPSSKLAAACAQAMATSHIFRIMFVNQGKVYEVYARKVTPGELFGSTAVEELLFGERSSVVLDPAEERIQGEFSCVL